MEAPPTEDAPRSTPSTESSVLPASLQEQPQEDTQQPLEVKPPILDEATLRRIEASLAVSASVQYELGPAFAVGKGPGGIPASIIELWKGILTADIPASVSANDPLRAWYSYGADYWESPEVPANDDGMLGGLAYVSPAELKESKTFLRRVAAARGTQLRRALDVGAGIGRITRELLLSEFTQGVDLLEQSPKMVAQAQASLGGHPRFGKAYTCGIQDFDFSAAAAAAGGSYDVVWLQWVVGCVADGDLVSFLQAAAEAITPETGFIFIKDNIARFRGPRTTSAFVYDDDDSSLARGQRYLEALFRRAGLVVVAVDAQREWEDDLLPVLMYALAKPGGIEIGAPPDLTEFGYSLPPAELFRAKLAIATAAMEGAAAAGLDVSENAGSSSSSGGGGGGSGSDTLC